jgi:tetratricopeptide (TPR) repeat protein
VLAVWNFDTGTGRWGAVHNCDLAVKNGVLTVLTTDDDPNFSLPASGPAGGKAIVLRYRTDEAFTMQIFWADSTGALDVSRHLDYPIPASSGDWAEITLPFWCQGILNTLRLDPNTSSEHPLEIDSIVLQNLESTDAWSSDAWMRIIQQQPGMTQTAFDFFKQSERWNEAAPFGLKLIEQNREDTQVWLRITPVLALTDDASTYSDFCSRMVQHFAESKNPETAERVVKACLLRADAIDLAKLPGDLLEKSLDDGTVPEWLPPWGWGSRALLAYRRGDAESAVKYVAKSEENKPIDLTHALNLAVLAMAQHQLGKAGEAKTALEEASQLITRLKGDPGRKGDHDLLIAEILFHEAEALMKEKEQPQESDSEEK